VPATVKAGSYFPQTTGVGDLYFAEPLLPARIGGNIGPVIEKQRGLNVGLARAGEKGVLVRPCIRIVTIRIVARSDMALARRFEDVKLALRAVSWWAGSAQYFLRASQSGLKPCS
jgi:hypothetical protein